jgi:exopolysaccharide biosynthesis WecB/TagA/CpsF family protein
MPTDRQEFLGLRFDALSSEEVLARLSAMTPQSRYGYVVTPNVDHMVRLDEGAEAGSALRPVYEDADLCLCDSRVLRLLARMRGVHLPVVPGSELTALVLDQIVQPGDQVAIVGGDEQLLAAIGARYPGVDFVQHRPPMGLRDNPAARRAAAQFIAQSGARFTFIAVGSPQQELIAAEARQIPGAAGMALCVGAGLDFLTGRQKRAPRLAQRLGLEWAHRLLSNPRRMWRRYLLEGPRIFLLAYRWPGPASEGAAVK